MVFKVSKNNYKYFKNTDSKLNPRVYITISTHFITRNNSHITVNAYRDGCMI